MIDIKELTLEEKIGQMILAGFSSRYYDNDVDEMIKKYKLGNVILFTRNIGSKEELADLTEGLQKNFIKNIKVPGFIAIDQEGGMVTRIYRDAVFFSGNMAFAAAKVKGSTLIEGKIEGEELRALGINMNLAPVMDVNCNPDNPLIGARSYSDKPEKVAELGIDLVKGLKESGVIAVCKHFPGHGDTDMDSHLSLPSVNHSMERLQKVELVPFKKAIENGLDGILSAHVIFPALESEKVPATLSYKVLTELLKNKMGFKGLIITDCMEMKAISEYYGSEKAAVMAVKAGADILCISHSKNVVINCVQAIKKAVLEGELEEDRIDAAVTKILEIKNKYRLFDNAYPDLEKVKNFVGCKKNKQFAGEISDKSITLIKDEKKLLPVKGKVVAISTKAVVLTGVDVQIDMHVPFCESVRQKFGGEAFVIPVNPEEALIERIVLSCKNADRVIIGTYNAAMNKEQLELIDRINQVNKNIIIAALRNPYDFIKMKNISTYLNCYEYTDLSVESIIKVISGEIKALGVSPVEL